MVTTAQKSKDEEKKPANGAKEASKALVEQPKDTQLALPNFKTDEEGWETRESGEERLYWHVREGSAIKGFAVDTDSFFVQRKNKDGELEEDERLFIKVETTAPTLAVSSKDGEMPEPRIIPAGALVWVGINHGLTKLYNEVVTSKFVLEVLLVSPKKVDIGNAQTVWRFGIKVRPSKRIRTISILQNQDPAQTGETPF